MSSQRPRDSSSAVTDRLTSSISAPVTAPRRVPSVAVARRSSGAKDARLRTPRLSESIATCPSTSSASAGIQRVPRRPALTQMPRSRVRSSESSERITRPTRLPRHTTGMPVICRSVFISALTTFPQNPASAIIRAPRRIIARQFLPKADFVDNLRAVINIYTQKLLQMRPIYVTILLNMQHLSGGMRQSHVICNLDAIMTEKNIFLT